MSTRWSGVFPALTTPFRDDLRVDHAALGAHIERMLQAGVHGLVLLGSLGESGSLSTEEKLAILTTAVGAVARRVPVLAGVAEPTPEDAERRSGEATAAGADGVMLLPPMRYRGDPRETLTYLARVAGASTLPVMIYTNPVAYGTDVRPEMFAELSRVPSIVALKESSEDPRRITDIIGLTEDRYQIFIGVDDLALESFLLGAVGWVAGLVCAFPEESVALYGLAQAGHWEEARRLYRWFMPLLHLDATPRFVQAIKLVQELVGLTSARVRPPRLGLPQEERSRIERVVHRAREHGGELEALIRLGGECARSAGKG